MTAGSETLPEPSAPVLAAPAPTRPFYWSVRRELWENRSITVAPLAAGGVVLFAVTLSSITLARGLHELPALDPSMQAGLLRSLCGAAALVVLATSAIVGVFYCLGALFNERRDRSILFWKSLPVSNVTTVLAKASIPLAVLPLVTFGTIVALQLVMLALGSIVLLLNGLSPLVPWTGVPVLSMSVELLYGLVVLALWHAPIYGWLLLISGWARRTTFLWAVLPPLGLVVIERIAFDSTRIGHFLLHRLGGGFALAFAPAPDGSSPSDPMLRLDPAPFLSSPDLWLGLAVAAAFLAACIWLRRNREPL